MGKIIRLKQIHKFIRPYESVLVGGVFDLFHVGHLRYLKECSKYGKLLTVIVQSDKTVSYRKGFNRPIIKQKRRAEIISHLDFVDFVIILDKPSHYENYLKIIQPKIFIFSKENMKYRKNRKKLIQKQFPKIKVIFLPKNVRRSSTSIIINKIKSKRNYNLIKDPIKRKLYYLADKNDSNIGKISALITYGEKILVSSSNDDKKELHAEIIVLEKAKKKKIPLNLCKMYVLIPPCIMCAKEILKNKIPKIFYLNPYGNDDGIKFLRKNKVKIKKYI
tara:strand:+ start:8542 stop:9369 length:828 start_codon:yes stop_codon:yes gene_type:complete